MAKDYVPRTDADLAAWSRNLAARVGEDPLAFNLSPERAAAYAAATARYGLELLRVNTESLRTGPVVAEKNLARRSLVALSREIVASARAAPDSDAARLVLLGLKPRAVPRREVPAPALAPRLTVEAGPGRGLTVRLRDAGNESSRARPPGVVGAALFLHAGPVAAEDPAQWRYVGSTAATRHRLRVDEPGLVRLWVTAHWLDARLRPGPDATPVQSYAPPGLGDLARAG